MRPASETHLALLQAAHALRIERAASGQGATLLELVHRSQVGYKVARAMVPKLKERGHLLVVGQRRVGYRNRPVAEYAPAPPKTPTVLSVEDVQDSVGWVGLNSCLSSWNR